MCGSESLGRGRFLCVSFVIADAFLTGFFCCVLWSAEFDGSKAALPKSVRCESACCALMASVKLAGRRVEHTLHCLELRFSFSKVQAEQDHGIVIATVR